MVKYKCASIRSSFRAWKIVLKRD